MPKKRKKGNLPPGTSVGDTYTGTLEVQKVYYSTERFTAMGVRDSSGRFFAAVGPDLTDIDPGATIDVTGVWVSHAKYGLQLEIQSSKLNSMDHRKGFIETTLAFAEKGERSLLQGVLHSIYDSHGEDSIDAIIEQRVEGIPEGYRSELQRIWDLLNLKLERDTRMATLASLHELGIWASLAEDVYAAYGEFSKEMITTCPYEVALECGVPFDIADGIAKREGVEYDEELREQMLVMFSLESAAECGHCFVMRSNLVRGMMKMLIRRDGISEDEAEARRNRFWNAIEVCHQRQLVRIDVEGRVYLYGLDEAEEMLARNIAVRHVGYRGVIEQLARKLPEEGIDDLLRDMATEIRVDASEEGAEFSNEQMMAIRCALTEPVSIITGGPGTGKTTVCRGIVRAFDRCGIRYSLCSPTGRGAKRLAEAVGRDAATIHRLLKYDPEKDAWNHDVMNQLRCEAIIIDEASMVDVLLFKTLMDAAPFAGRIIIVGDDDQLPSVGPGRVLNDLMACDSVRVTELSRIFRQDAGNDIISVAHDIRNGTFPDIPLLPVEEDGTFGDVGSNGCWMESENDPDQLKRRLVDLVDALARDHHIDVEGVQVLTPMRRGPLGCESLNALLQNEFNPSRPGVRECKYRGKFYRVGDRVMQIRNDYHHEIFNGDMGRVVAAKDQYVRIEFDGKLVDYAGRQLENIEHSFAISTHKSQGSEFPVGVIVLHQNHGRMLRRNLLYTAITRCSDQAVIIGQEAAVNAAVADDREDMRLTTLRERIESLISILGDEEDEEVGFEWDS